MIVLPLLALAMNIVLVMKLLIALALAFALVLKLPLALALDLALVLKFPLVITPRRAMMDMTIIMMILMSSRTSQVCGLESISGQKCS